MEQYTEIFVSIDVAKLRNAIAVADGERGGEVRFIGEVDATDDSMWRITQKIAAKHGRVHFCYEAGDRLWPAQADYLNGAPMRRGRPFVDPPEARRPH